MCRTLVIIRKISTGHGRKVEVSCFALKGLISIMTGDVLYIIPLITWLLAKKKKLQLTSHCVSFYNSFVTIHSVDQKRNSPPKTLTSLSNRIRVVAKWADYWRSDNKDVYQREKKLTLLDSGHFMLIGRSIYANRPSEVRKAHASERRVPQHWE